MPDGRLHPGTAEPRPPGDDPPPTRIELVDVVQGLKRRIVAAHRADVERGVERQQRTADRRVLALDQIAGVQVQWADQLHGRFDGGRQLVLAADRAEDGREWFETVTPSDQQRVAGGGQHGQVGIQGADVRLEVALLLLVALPGQLAQDLVEHVECLVDQAGRQIGQVGRQQGMAVVGTKAREWLSGILAAAAGELP